MRGCSVVFVRRAIGNVAAHANERWPRIGFGGNNRFVQSVEVVGILDGLRVPTVRIETLADVLVERKRRIALDRDVVVVVEIDEPAKAQMACE